MSHSNIRTEKICLNCGTETTGRYCPACGQENIEPKQSLWHLINHFFSDVTHFDGKFFVTVKDLFRKPGFLSREYMMGRRASYLDPIRMYIFTSAIFFLITLSRVNVNDMFKEQEASTEVQKKPDLKTLLSDAETKQDSAEIRQAFQLLTKPHVKVDKDSTQHTGGVKVSLEKSDYLSVAAYDSTQKALPADQRDGWIRRKVTIKTIELNLRRKKEGVGLYKEMIGIFLHNFPKVLFISLPAFAFILKLLYVRRKTFYYVDHGIFSVHLFIFSFLIILALIAISTFKNYTGWHWLDWLFLIGVLYPIYYYYKAMRTFYGQGRGKTILKYILLFFMAFFVQLIIVVGAIMVTVYEA